MGDLRPGQSRRLDLQLTANRPGTLAAMLAARGEGNLRSEDRFAWKWRPRSWTSP